MSMDLVLKLREARRLRGISQREVATLSGVGEKTISSFETGQRVESLKLTQLTRLLAAYGLTEEEFFGETIEHRAFGETYIVNPELRDLVNRLRALDDIRQGTIIRTFRNMLELAEQSCRRGRRLL